MVIQFYTPRYLNVTLDSISETEDIPAEGKPNSASKPSNISA